MRLTRHGWGVAGTGLALIASAVVLATPQLLWAAAGVGAVLLADQYVFLRTLLATQKELAVSVTLDRARPSVDTETTVTVTVERADSHGPMQIALDLPAAADRTTPLTLGLGEATTGERAASVTWAVAGTYEIGPPRVTMTDRLGLFAAAFRPTATATVDVRPQQPETMHLGRSGEQIAGSFGEHTAGQSGGGIEPAELREYQPGDPLNRIDWKATTRLDEPHVTTAEAETDRETILLVDHRATMGTGEAPVQPIAYLRHAALAIVDSARDLGDPIGLYTVGDEGITTAEPPQRGAKQYEAVATTIRTLTPTTTAPAPTAPGAARARASGGSDVSTALQAASRLEPSRTAFATQLEPFLADTSSYLHRVADQPLFAAAETFLTALQGRVWTVLMTDDSRREELIETVKVARGQTGHVLVLLTPQVFFEADGLADLDAAYRRYTEFDRFRQRLETMDRVTALEVAPGERVETVLTAGGARQ